MCCVSITHTEGYQDPAGSSRPSLPPFRAPWKLRKGPRGRGKEAGWPSVFSAPPPPSLPSSLSSPPPSFLSEAWPEPRGTYSREGGERRRSLLTSGHLGRR